MIRDFVIDDLSVNFFSGSPGSLDPKAILSRSSHGDQCSNLRLTVLLTEASINQYLWESGSKTTRCALLPEGAVLKGNINFFRA